MILQVSSRSDICAMYPQWLINRLKAGMVMVRNPYNEHLVSKINLSHEVVDCISFMTKDPLSMLPYLKEIDQLKYQYYFMVTITPYDNDLETNLRPKLEIIKTFRKLSTMLGKKRVIWRYDPILLNARYTKEFHYKMFDKMCALLYQYTEIVIISFIDIYQNISGLFDEINAADVMDLAAKLGKIANKYHLKIQTCSEKYHLEQFGIQHGSCLDRHYLEELIGGKLKIKKNQNRKHCHCVASIDIGAYNSCLNGCKYCYANKQNVYHNVLQHDKNSPLLIGWPTSEDKVVNRKVTSNIDWQIQLKI